MTFAEVCKSHEAGEELHFAHPDIFGTLYFTKDGELGYLSRTGNEEKPPLWLSDFDRDDWFLMPLADD